MRTGDTLTGLDIVVTDRISTVTGQLRDDKGAPITDGTVLVFSSDNSTWADDSRFVQAARPDQEGKCQIRGLGQRFTLGEADTHALMLTLSSPQ